MKARDSGVSAALAKRRTRRGNTISSASKGLKEKRKKNLLPHFRNLLPLSYSLRMATKEAR